MTPGPVAVWVLAMQYPRPHISRCTAAAERAQVTRISFVAVARFGRIARSLDTYSRSSSIHGNVVVVNAHWVRAASRVDSSSFTSASLGSCFGASG